MNIPDPYIQRAAEIFKVPAAQVTPAMRQYAKQERYASAYTVHGSLHPNLLTQLAIAKAKVPR